MQVSASIFEKSLANNVKTIESIRDEVAARSIFNAWRFALAGAGFGVLTFLRLRRFARSDFIGGGVMGLAFCVGILLQLIGLRYTLPSTSSFLTSLCVIFAPLAQRLIFRRPLGTPTIIAVVTALVGMFILSQPNPHAATAQTMVQTPPFPHLGEILTVIGAVLFTTQIMAIDHFGKTADATRLTFVMLLVTCLASLMVGITLGGGRFHNARVLGTLAADHKFLAYFAGLAFISSMLTQYLMNRYQPLLAPATAAVVYCLEPVFGTLFSVGFGTERLSGITIVGGSIILVAVLIVARKNA